MSEEGSYEYNYELSNLRARAILKPWQRLVFIPIVSLIEDMEKPCLKILVKMRFPSRKTDVLTLISLESIQKTQSWNYSLEKKSLGWKYS